MGDKVLVAVAAILKEYSRENDIVARYGGEEFIIVLKNCSLEDAKKKAEEIRKRVEQLCVESLHVTMSFGVASYSEHLRSFEELVNVADEALYLAKESGRNRVC